MAHDVPVVRSIVAVMAGFFTVMVLGAAADVVLANGSLYVKLGYETAFTVLAGYITARIAARKPITHVVVMAGIVLVGRTLIALATWDVLPMWFNVGVLVLILPAATAGAMLSAVRSRSTA